jgi:phospholipase/carboxylesterase
VTELVYSGRAAAANPPAGMLILHHGRGSDERDLIGIAEVLDPGQRLELVTPRAPLRLPGTPGYHWYVVPRVGYPDRPTFEAAVSAIAQLHDRLWETTGIAPSRTVIGGFSMGAVMSYALGLSAERPAPAGILAFSGFVPSVDGWEPSLQDRAGLPVFIAHGRQDPVIGVEFARQAAELLTAGGLKVEYREHDGGHRIDRGDLQAAAEWLDRLPGIGTADPHSA